MRPLLKIGVPDREPFVHEDDVGFHRGRDRKPQSHVHAGRVGSDRHGKELAQLGEVLHLVDEAVRLPSRQAKQRAAHPNVLDPAGLAVHAEIEIDQRGDTADHVEAARDGPIDARKGAQQRRLPAAVVAPQAQSVTRQETEREVVQGPDDRQLAAMADATSGRGPQEMLLERAVRNVVQRKLDHHSLGFDVGHGVTSNTRFGLVVAREAIKPSTKGQPESRWSTYKRRDRATGPTRDGE